MSTISGRAPPAPEAWQTRGAAAAPLGRLAWIDALRGAALVGMIVYHGAWDLNAFGITDLDPGADAGWRALGNGEAGLFLALSGVGLSLAARRNPSRRAAMFRLGRIALAAVFVSAATRVAVPDAPIWFGILHCIVATNLVALVVWRAANPVLLVFALAASLMPIVLRGVVGVGWAWTGLASDEPVTLDFRPILPWLALVLCGIVFGRTSLMTRCNQASAFMTMPRSLSWAGRHSLAIYLVHQPLMIGTLVLGTAAMRSQDRDATLLRQPPQAAAFLQQCRVACSARGGEPDLCASTCHCIVTSVSRAVPPKWWSSGRPKPGFDEAVALCSQGSPNRHH